MFRITIFAARRVFPPLLITPAKASKPFMKLTGPDAIPPPDSVSLLPRSVEKFVPVPEPHLKSIPSVRVSPMIDSMLSLTELMKHAEHCGLGCTPTLNHTGELNAIFCSTSRFVSSSRNASRDAPSAKYPPSSPHRTMVFTTRPISCRTDPSRCGAALRFGAGLKVMQIGFDRFVEADNEKRVDRRSVVLKFQRKTPMPCRWPVLRTQPNSRCSA